MSLPTPPKRSLFSNIPLRWVLIVPFLLQILGTMGLLGYLCYRSGQEAVEHLADELMTEMGDRVGQHLDSYLGKAQAVNQMNLDGVTAGILDLNNFEALGKYFYRQRNSFDFAYVNFGSPEGGFIGAGYGSDNILEIAEISRSNPNLLRYYAVNPAGDRQRLLGTVKNPQTQQRAWYLDAIKAGRPIWSSIYTWGDLPDHISLSASTPVYNAQKELQGVLGIDLELSQISHFLQTLNHDQTGSIFILERSGLMIASSEQESSAPLVNGQAQRLLAVNSKKPIIRNVTQALIAKLGSLKAIAPSQNQTIQRLQPTQLPPLWVKVSPYQDRYGLDWLVITVVPESHFMGVIQANRQGTILLAGLTFLVVTGMVILTARWITRPLEQLGRASEALARGEWQEPLPEQGAITELKRLSLSFNQMAVQVRQSFQQVENALQDSREMYQKMVQTQSDFILRSQPDTTITFANEALCHALNSPLEQVMGQKWVNFAHPDDLEKINQQIGALTPDNPSFIAENRDRRAEGQIGWTQWINQGIFNEQGQLIEIQSVGRDITNLKQIEFKLRESQHFIERIMEATPMLLYIYDLIENRNVYMNHAIADVLGYSSTEIQTMGDNLLPTICHPDDLPRVYEARQQASRLQDDEIIEIEYRVRDARGKFHWFTSQDRVFARAEDGQVRQLLGTSLDITDRKLAEIKTQQVQNFLTLIIENIPNMLFVKEAKNLKFVRFNKAGEDLLGYSRAELIGKSDYDFFPPEEADFFIAKDREVFARREGLDIPQETIQTKQQGTRILHTKKFPIFDDTGQPQYLLGISEDITESIESENRMTQLARHIPGVIYQFRLRADGTSHFPYASEGIREIYGVTPQAVREDASAIFAVLHPDDGERVRQSILDSATNLTPWHCEYRVRFADGQVIWVVGYATPRREADGSTIWSGYITNISDRKQAEIALQESETKFSTIFQNNPDPVWIALFESGYFVDINTSLWEFLGTPQEEIIGKTAVELGIWDNLEDWHRLKQRLIQQGTVQNFEVRVRTRAGDIKTVLISAARTCLGGQDCLISALKDISERKQAEALLIEAKEQAEKAESKLQKSQINLELANQKLLKLVDTDGLTQIANRRCFNIRLRQEWKRLYREKQPLSLLLFDVDYFKYYNDLYGHPQGDVSLIQIAQTARSVVKRPADLVARFGGEEFVVILPNTALDGAAAIAEKIRLAVIQLNIPHQGSKISHLVTISLGISCQIPGQDSSPSTLIHQADQALFRAKKQGRNQFVIFSADNA